MFATETHLVTNTALLTFTRITNLPQGTQQSIANGTASNMHSPLGGTTEPINHQGNAEIPVRIRNDGNTESTKRLDDVGNAETAGRINHGSIADTTGRFNDGGVAETSAQLPDASYEEPVTTVPGPSNTQNKKRRKIFQFLRQKSWA